MGQRDDAEHATENRIGHVLLRGGIDQHDRRALAHRREERAGDRDRQRMRERHQPVARQVHRPGEEARKRLPADLNARQQGAARDRAGGVARHHDREAAGAVVEAVADERRYAADP
jgi:hypothetical protein